MENNILQIIADNPSLLEALRKLFEKQFEAPTEMKNLPASISDELLGQFLRARIAGYSAVDSVFREIEKYKTIKDESSRSNPAR